MPPRVMITLHIQFLSHDSHQTPKSFGCEMEECRNKETMVETFLRRGLEGSTSQSQIKKRKCSRFLSIASNI
jgi:hypothetical protein